MFPIDGIMWMDTELLEQGETEDEYDRFVEVCKIEHERTLGEIRYQQDNGLPRSRLATGDRTCKEQA